MLHTHPHIPHPLHIPTSRYLLFKKCMCLSVITHRMGFSITILVRYPTISAGRARIAAYTDGHSGGWRSIAYPRTRRPLAFFRLSNSPFFHSPFLPFLPTFPPHSLPHSLVTHPTVPGGTTQRTSEPTRTQVTGQPGVHQRHGCHAGPHVLRHRWHC